MKALSAQSIRQIPGAVASRHILLLLVVSAILVFASRTFGTDLSLAKGYNLVSFYPQPKNTAIKDLIEPIKASVIAVQTLDGGTMLTYDPADPDNATLTTIEGGRGYWFSMSEAATLSYETLSKKTSVPLKQGWNMIGLYITENQSAADAVSGMQNVSAIWGYSNATWQAYDPKDAALSDLQTLEPNKGYYILITEDTDFAGGVDGNNPPVATIVADSSAQVKTAITLDGTTSSDADGDTLTYQWAVDSFPTGADSAYTLTGDTTNTATLTSTAVGDYVVSLIVNDGYEDSEKATATISFTNTTPVATINSSKTGKVNLEKVLDGSTSSDADGDTLTYKWTVTSFPTGADSAYTLSRDTTSMAKFTTTAVGDYVITLVVNDSTIESSPATLAFSVDQKPMPVIDAPKSGRLNAPVYLDGRSSFDPNDTAITYKWTVTSFPTGADSAYTLSNDTTGVASFKSTVEGEYVITLTVDNGVDDPVSETMRITLDASGIGVVSADNSDRDGDGIKNEDDTFADDTTEFIDSDGDGTGNFADGDEDGDGTADRDDAFPFDATLSAYTVFAETETNDNPELANSVVDGVGTQITYPFSLTGVIDVHVWDGNNVDEDSDYFKFTAKSGDVISAVVFKTGANADGFEPQISFLDTNGTALNNVQTNVNDKFYAAVASVVIATDGDHYIAINDNKLGDSSDWTYQIDVFKDADFDAVDDGRELAIGCNYAKPDSDGDGLFDSTETLITDKTFMAGAPATIFDVDGDGVPNWFDDDSDGDGIPDKREGYLDLDEDNLPNFVDTDSDGNGIDDDVEAGDNPLIPDDSDSDGTPDFADMDDDNDLVWDKYDNDRRTIMETSKDIYLSGCYLTVGTSDIQDLIRAGGTLSIEGSGFSLTAASNIVIFRGANDLYNVPATTATANLLTVTVPNGSYDTLAVLNLENAADYRLSENKPVSPLDPEKPLLYELDMSDGVGNLEVGTSVTLNGENLSDVTKVCFNTITVSASPTGSTAVTVTVPSDAQSGNLYVITGSGEESNRIGAKVVKNTAAQVTLPTGATVDITTLEVETGLTSVTNPDATGACTVPIDNTSMDYITCYMPEGVGADDVESTYLTGIAFPDDTSVAINTTTTAVYFTFITVGIESMVDPASLKDAVGLVTALSQVTDLKNAIETELAADPYFFSKSDQNAAFNEKAMYAAQAARETIDSAIADGTLTKRSATSAVRQFSQLLELLDANLRGASLDIKPTVTPEEQYDIKVRQNSSRETDLTLENDTMLLLSAALLNPKSKNVLGKDGHIVGAYDPNIVGTQGGLFSLWNAATKDFDGPNGQNCIAEVITSGMIEPFPDSSDTLRKRVYFNLLIRALIDNAFLPIMDEIINFRLGKTELSYICEILKGQYYNVYKNVLDYAYKGDGWNAAKTFVKDFVMFDINLTLGSIKKGLSSVDDLDGFIIPFLVRRYGKALIAKIGTQIAKKWATKFIPIFGQVWTALDYGNKGIAMGKYISDSKTVPGYLTFEVEWPYKIVAVHPNTAKPEDKPLKVLVKGLFSVSESRTGLFSWKKNWGDIGFLREYDLEIVDIEDEPLISPDGYQVVKVFMPAAYRKDLKHEDKVEVLYYNFRTGVEDITNPDEFILIDDKLILDRLDPSEGGDGDTVMIYGSGFSDTLSENKVTFAGDEGARLSAVCSNVSEESLTVTAPKGVKTGDVIVEVDPQTSNALTFTVNDGEVTFAFGDNGSANDDTFALYVDNKLVKSMSAPSRYVSVTLTLESGVHSVRLKGISAPDGIGTYFIEVTGDASLSDSGSDLIAGVTKTYSITVSESTESIRVPPLPPNFFKTLQSEERKED